jgi:hypothetical protein
VGFKLVSPAVQVQLPRPGLEWNITHRRTVRILRRRWRIQVVRIDNALGGAAEWQPHADLSGIRTKADSSVRHARSGPGGQIRKPIADLTARSELNNLCEGFTGEQRQPKYKRCCESDSSQQPMHLTNLFCEVRTA